MIDIFGPLPTTDDPLTFSHRHERSCRTIHLAISAILSFPPPPSLSLSKVSFPFEVAICVIGPVYICAKASSSTLRRRCAFDRRFAIRDERKEKRSRRISRVSKRFVTYLFFPFFLLFSGDRKVRKGRVFSKYRGNFKGRDWMDVKRIEAIAPWTVGNLQTFFPSFFQKFRILLPSFLLSFLRSIDGSIIPEEETTHFRRRDGKKREASLLYLSKMLLIPGTRAPTGEPLEREFYRNRALIAAPLKLSQPAIKVARIN